MTRHRLLIIDHEGLQAYRLQDGIPVIDATFAPGNTGVTEFGAYLKHNKGHSTYTLLAEFSEEGFYLDAVPHVIGPDRAALLKRKLAQHFLGSQYATAIPMGRESGGRRDERILFTALTHTASIDPWMECLRQYEAAISGLYTTALLVPQLLRHYGHRTPTVQNENRGMFVCLTPSGIRQVFLVDGKLRFSRLTPPPEGRYTEWAPQCYNETQKTLQYLSSQRWIARDEKLSVWLLLHPQDFAAYFEACRNNDSLDFHFLDLTEAPRVLGSNMTFDSSDARALFMFMALNVRSSVAQLASGKDRRFYRLARIRTGLRALSLAILIGAFLYGFKTQLDTRELARNTLILQQESAHDQVRYKQIIDSLPPAPASPATLQAVVARYDRIAHIAHSPFAALIDLSRALDRDSSIQLKKLDWTLLNWKTPQPAPQTISGATAWLAQTHYEIAIEAQLQSNAPLSAREVLQRIEDFIQLLRSQGNSIVTLVKPPIDIESTQDLRSAQQESATSFDFSLRMQKPIDAETSAKNDHE